MDHCHFWLPHKKRYCKFPVIGGKQLCNIHTMDEGGIRARMPCPVDPKHTIFVTDVEKHVLVCSKVKDAAFIQSQKLFVENINVKEGIPENALLTDFVVTESEALMWARKLAIAMKEIEAMVGIGSVDMDNIVDEGTVDMIGKHNIQNDKLVENILIWTDPMKELRVSQSLAVVKEASRLV
jgi:hypothetical protein